MRPAFTLCLLWQALYPGPAGGEHPTADRAGCLASGTCYSLHHATIHQLAALEACSLRGGKLSTVHGGSELRAVLELLRTGPGPGGGSKNLLFWVALERKKTNCTQEDEPLRGFSWLSLHGGGQENETLGWVQEPQRSCTSRRCAGLQVAAGVEPAGWRARGCHLRADGYLCKYQFEGLCPAPRPGAASNLSYRAPFQLSSAALDFSPPGTEVSALCPGQLTVSASCVVNEVGTHWDGLPSAGVLCPCQGRYLLAGKCTDFPNCVDDLGRFTCECAEGFELSKDGRSCVITGEGEATPGESKVATAASPLPRTESPRVHQKPGATSFVSEEGSPATSIPEIPWWGEQSTLSTLQMSPQIKSKGTITPSESLILTFNSTSPSTTLQNFDSSSTLVLLLVSIAVVVLVILTMTVLGLFKLCFHKSPVPSPRKGHLAESGAENDAEAADLRSGSALGTDSGVKVGDCGLRDRAEGASLTGSSLGSGEV
ncbi:C-type lectin domain family 14 member A [Rhynchocyon petersi]